MLEIRQILFPTDFSRCAEEAFEHALLWARDWGAKLHLLHARVHGDDDVEDPANHFPDPEELRRRLSETSRVELERLKDSRIVGDVTIELAQPRGIAPAPVILEYAEDHDIDLIVLGTHGRRGLRQLVLGSVATEVVRRSPCPVLTVRLAADAPAVRMPRRILVPVDFSEPSDVGVAHARGLAARADARIDLLHVIEVPRIPDVYGMTEYSAAGNLDEVEGKARESLDEIAQDLGGPDKVSCHVQQGHAAHEIVDFADKTRAEAIVIATHGLTGLQRLLMGSVAEQVVSRAACPVLTVKPFGRSLVQAAT
jgi:nucleotide-binding universal stress UspA family protein